MSERLDTTYCHRHEALVLVVEVVRSNHASGVAFITAVLGCGCRKAFLGSAKRWPRHRSRP